MTIMSRHKFRSALLAAVLCSTLMACGGVSEPVNTTAAGNDSATPPAPGQTVPGSVDWGQPPPQFAGDPAFDVSQTTLDNNILCTGFAHPDKPPILLVHGTFTTGPEQYDWTYVPLLDQLGYDVCVVTYPDRGLGDQQVSAEYVVNAVHRIYQKTGRKIEMIGHSQGATMPRWAIKWWPSLQSEISDFVMEAGPNHGTTILGVVPSGALPLEPAAFYQFAPDSKFVAVLNKGDETPGDIAYTSLYSTTDELVEPSAPVPTAALDWQQNNPQVTNINLQDVCPGHIVDHVTIGTTDPLAFALAIDAITHAGPANFERAGGMTLCSLPLLDISGLAQPGTGAAVLLGILQGEASYGLPTGLDLSAGEPPLKPYTQ